MLRLQFAAQHAVIARSEGQQARHREDSEEDSGELVQGLAVELGEELGVPRVREAHKNVQDGAELDLLFLGDLGQQVHRSRHADGRTTGPEVRDGAWVSKGARWWAWLSAETAVKILPGARAAALTRSPAAHVAEFASCATVETTLSTCRVALRLVEVHGGHLCADANAQGSV